MSLPLSELRRIVDEATDARELQKVLSELKFRSRKAARELEKEAQTRHDAFAQSKALRPAKFTKQPDLFGTNHDTKRQRTALVLGSGLSDHLPTPIKNVPKCAKTKPKFPPTGEQIAAVEAFMRGGSLKISAFAGAGKTSTLKLMANERSDRGLYLAFNSKIAKEAKLDFPGYVDCRTTHSLAARAAQAIYKYNRNKMFNTVRATQLAAILELRPVQLEKAVTLTEAQQAHLLLSTIRRFCQSDDQELSDHHSSMTGRLLGLKSETRAEVHRWVQHQARALWMRMCDAGDGIPLSHDGYLKLWSLDSPRLHYDYVLLDEAQDTNPVVLSVLQAQKAQMVYVGDQHQQIYEWRGAVNAMATIATDDAKKLTQSFRFGPAIAAAATLILSKLGEKSRLTGNQRISSQILETTEVDAVLARTNATVIAEALTTKESGRKPFIVGGTQDLERLVSDVFSLQDGVPGSHPDFFGFSSWNDVVAFASTDEGEDLRPFVTLVESNGPKRLWAAIKSSVSDIESADVCLSTAHKAKGAEWRSVRIADDFSANASDGEPIPESEARLFYVAITRAKEILSISPTLLSAFTQTPRFASDSEAADARLRSRTRPALSTPPPPTRSRASAPAVAGKVTMRVAAPNSVVRPPPPPPSPEATRSIVARPNPDEIITASAPTTKRKRGVLTTLFGTGSRDK